MKKFLLMLTLCVGLIGGISTVNNMMEAANVRGYWVYLRCKFQSGQTTNRSYPVAAKNPGEAQRIALGRARNQGLKNCVVTRTVAK